MTMRPAISSTVSAAAKATDSSTPQAAMAVISTRIAVTAAQRGAGISSIT